MSILVVIIALTLLIFVHELGHFLTAKWARLRVDEFGFGLPPRLWGKRVGETIYSINWLPFGGFVKIFGEGGEGKEEEKSFASQKPWKRILILAAGAVMNFLFGWLLISLIFAFGSRSAIDGENRAYARDVTIAVGDVAPGSPAEQAGIKAEDVVRRIIAPTPESEIVVETSDEFIETIKAYRGREISIDLERNGEVVRVSLTPRENPPPGEGAMGVSIFESGMVKYPVPQAFYIGAKVSADISTQILREFWNILAKLVSQGEVGADIMGPVGIVGVAKGAINSGFAQLVQLVALISLNLGTLNLLPIPALDGGRILFVLVEKIKGSPVPKKAEQIAHGVGFLLLIGLLVAVTIHDIYRLL
jgi:regulator of sigma E protease